MTKKIFYDYLMSFIGIPYIWGGYNRDGLDCSGAIQLWLAAIGEDPKGDQTANKLYKYSKKYYGLSASPFLGCLAYYGGKKIIHVAMCLDHYFIIEAGGGSRHITTVKKARAANAEIRIRPRNYRNDLVGIYGFGLPW